MADGGSVRNNVIAIIQAVDLEYGATLFVDYLADPRFRDTALAVDEFDRQVDFIRTVSDAASAVDNASMAPGKGFADQVTATDGSSMAFAPGVIADSVTVDDAVILQVAFNLTFADIVTVADDFQFVLATVYNLNFADGVVATDAATTAVDKVLADTATPVDAFSRDVAFVRTFADTAPTADGVAMSGGTLKSVSFTDEVTTDDLFSPASTMPVSFADSVVTSDLFATDRTIPVSFADAVTTSDLATPALTKPVSFADAVTTSDLATPGLTKPVSFADAVTTSDLFSPASNIVRTLSDGMTPTDAVSLPLSKVVNFADSVAMADGMARDTMWDNVELLMQGNGPFLGTNYATWRDSSTFNKPVTVLSQLPFQGAVSPYSSAGNSFDYASKGGSAYFGAVGSDALSTPQSNDFHFPAGTDFTIELWFLCATDSPPDFNNDRTGCLLSTFPSANQTAGWTLNLQGSGGVAGPTGAGSIYMEIIAGGGTYEVVVAPATVANPWTQNQWHHVAVCRVGTVTTIYVDGVNRNSYTLPDQDLVASGPLVIGRSYASAINRIFKGYISDVRIIKNAAAYTANFTPPTAPTPVVAGTVLKLNFGDAAIWDSARHHNFHHDGATVQGSLFDTPCIYFDGNNRNVQTPFMLAARVAPMAQDFTVECWFWIAGNSAPDPSSARSGALISTWPNGGSLTGFILYVGGDAVSTGTYLGFQMYNNDGSSSFAISSTGAPISKPGWHHAAFSRVGQTGYLHLDGTLVASGTIPFPVIPPSTPNYLNPVLLGMTPYPSYPLPLFGYIDDARYTVGKARYGAGNFALQYAPFPSGQTKFGNRFALLPNESTAATDAASPVNVPGVITFVKAYGTAPSITTYNITFNGTLAGDLAIVMLSNSTTAVPAAPAGWLTADTYTWAIGSYKDAAFYKVLTAADISAGSVQFTGLDPFNATMRVFFYRGPTSIALASRVNSASGNIVIPGFTKSAGCRGLILGAISRNDSASLITVPAGAVQRIAFYQSAGPAFGTRGDDFVNPASYTNGASITYTGGGGEGSGQVGWAYELR